MEKELADLRKEIVEARNLTIKNDNLLKNLGSDLKVMARKQEAFERKQWISSAAAYLAFAVLAGAIGFFGAQGYVAQARAENETLRTRAEEATSSAQLAKEELDAARTASAAALAAYLALDNAATPAEREKAALALAQVDRTKLSRLEARALDDRGRDVLQALADEKMEAGRTAYLRQNYRETVSEISKALELWPQHPSAPDYAFYLGSAAIEIRDNELAAQHLQRFVEQGGRRNKDYGYLLLARAYEALGRKEQAEKAYRDGIAAFPGSDFNRQMRNGLRRLLRQD